MKSEQLSIADVLVLGYGDSSGHNQSEASRDRARREDSDGTTRRRQSQILDYIAKTGYDGVVYPELNEQFGLGSQSSSSALSNLHKEGVIERLREKRSRCHIYVLSAFVGGRELAPFKSNICRHCGGKN